MQEHIQAADTFQNLSDTVPSRNINPTAIEKCSKFNLCSGIFQQAKKLQGYFFPGIPHVLAWIFWGMNK